MLPWLVPTLSATVLYGIGQGLVKRNISNVPPARFCLYLMVAKSMVNLGFFLTQAHPNPFSAEGRSFLLAGVFAYLLDGTAWILYFQSIVHGPIAIVGTVSAAYPAFTVLFARIFLSEQLSGLQYLGLALVICSCLGLSYSKPTPGSKARSTAWIPLAAGALLLWGVAQTIVKWSYGLPAANEANLALFNTVGGALTLGVYGLWGTRGSPRVGPEWGKSALPMGMMAAGDLAVIIASRLGPISVVTPLSGAYPLVTLGFAWLVLKEKITPLQWGCIVAISVGLFLSLGLRSLQ